MTHHNTAPAADTGLPIRKTHDLTTQRGRVAAWCDWFDLPEPKLKYRSGSLLTSSVGWIHEAGASIDWIVLGDPRGMAIAYRKGEMETRSFHKAYRQLDEAEQRMFVVALDAVTALDADMDQVMAILRDKVTAHRTRAA